MALEYTIATNSLLTPCELITLLGIGEPTCEETQNGSACHREIEHLVIFAWSRSPPSQEWVSRTFGLSAPTGLSFRIDSQELTSGHRRMIDLLRILLEAIPNDLVVYEEDEALLSCEIHTIVNAETAAS